METESKYLHIRPPREIVWAVVAFLVIASFFMLTKIKNEARGVSGVQPPSITVSGEGKEFVKPDIASVTIGVAKNNLDLLRAQQDAAKAIDAIVADLQKEGVAENDIKTISFSIYPQYDYRDGRQVFRGYEVRQTLEVKIRDLAKVGTILTGVARAGANEVGSLTFTVDDPKVAQAKAREQAITEAKEKAKVLSRQLGVRLGKITSYNESSGGGTPPPIFARSAEFGIGGDFAPPVPTGENEIRMNVSITYAIK